MIPTPEFAVQSCKCYAPSEETLRGLLISPTTEAQTKLDGWTMIVRRELDGPITLTSRNLKPIDASFVIDFRVPMDSLMIGEIYVPGEPATSVATAVAECKGAKFAAFGFYKWGGRLITEFDEADSVCSEFSIPQATKLVKQELIKGYSPICSGVDGYVIKESQWPTTKRWWKVKQRKTITLRLVGTKSGEYGGQFAHTVGSIHVVSDDGHIEAFASGMNAETRESFRSGAIPVGSLVEISYQRVLSQGGLREPQFVRVRTDRSDTSTIQDLISLEETGV